MADGDTALEWTTRIAGLDRLWARTRGEPSVRIAILDGPPDRASIAGAVAPSGVVEHGTHVHSIVSGSADGAVAGVAPGCAAFSIPIFAADGDGVCTQEHLAEAIHAALEARANIINISAAQQGGALALSSSLRGALQSAFDHDVLVVAATGNHGASSDALPAAAPGVLAVGAHDADGVPLLSSNWGPNQRAQGLIATGEEVPGACVGGGVCRATGSSFATAAVSGVAGLLMSVDVADGVAPSGARTRRALLDGAVAAEAGAVELAGPFLSGRLEASRALDALIKTRPQTNRGGVSMSEVSEAASPVAAPLAAADAQLPALTPAGCACGGEYGCGAKPPPQLAYAIGSLGVSFVSQTRRDAIWRKVNSGSVQGALKPITDGELLTLLNKEPHQAQAVVWTLSRAGTALYAIMPSGAYAAETYDTLVKEWSDQNVDLVSVAGIIAGRIQLYDGTALDVLVPDLRGFFAWNTSAYVASIKAALQMQNPNASQVFIDREVTRFLDKIEYALRNRGVAPEERALNAAATDAFNISTVIAQASEEGLTLRDVGAERSALGRPSDAYYDVLLTFFAPKDRLGTALLRARFTFDVGDTVPVLIGEPAVWYEY